MQFQQLSEIEEMNEETISSQFPLLSRLLQSVGASPLASSAALSATFVPPGSRSSIIKRSTNNTWGSSNSLYQENPQDQLPEPLAQADEGQPSTPLFHIESQQFFVPSKEAAPSLVDTIQASQDGETTA